MNNPGKLVLNMARNRLLATVSTLTLVTSGCGCGAALAAGHDHTLWIELGWQADDISLSKGDLDLPLGPLVPPAGLTAPLTQNLKSTRGNSIEGTINYAPEGGDWDFSASVRYGRSGGKSLINQSESPLPTEAFSSYHTYFHRSPYNIRHITQVKAVQGGHPTLNAEIDNRESHLIIDFDAGKDVGLGLFGTGSTSTLSAGVRFAHFALSRRVPNFHESPGNIHFQSTHNTVMRYVYTYPTGGHYVPWFHTKRREKWNDITANGGVTQTFTGIGPSIQWDSSALMWHDPRGGGISLDWGANVALLFGKQTKKIHHKTTDAQNCTGDRCQYHPPYTSNSNVRSNRTVTVPNVGGFAGLSLNYADAKFSLGYRADYFFNAVDGGFDTRKSENRGFFGPYASIGIGIGD